VRVKVGGSQTLNPPEKKVRRAKNEVKGLGFAEVYREFSLCFFSARYGWGKETGNG
jgi:hypothetical protein